MLPRKSNSDDPETRVRGRGSSRKCGDASMKNRTYAACALIFLCFAGTPALAQQQRDMMPHLQSQAVNPSLSSPGPGTSPLQPLAIGRELNSSTGRR